MDWVIFSGISIPLYKGQESAYLQRFPRLRSTGIIEMLIINVHTLYVTGYIRIPE